MTIWTEKLFRHAIRGARPLNAQPGHQRCESRHAEQKRRDQQSDAHVGAAPPIGGGDHAQPMLEFAAESFAGACTVLNHRDDQAGIEGAQPERPGGRHQRGTPLGREGAGTAARQVAGDLNGEDPSRVGSGKPRSLMVLGRDPPGCMAALRVVFRQRRCVRGIVGVDQTQRRNGGLGRGHVKEFRCTRRAKRARAAGRYTACLPGEGGGTADGGTERDGSSRRTAQR